MLNVGMVKAYIYNSLYYRLDNATNHGTTNLKSQCVSEDPLHLM